MKYKVFASRNTSLFLLHVLSEESPFNTTFEMSNITHILKSQVTLNKTGNEDVPIDYYQDTENPDNSTGYLDFNLLDPDTVTDLYKIAKEKNSMVEREVNRTVGRKQNNVNKNQAYYPEPAFIQKAMDLMKQSVYATRFRLQDTKEIRQRYADDIPYNAALLYGRLTQLRIKIENIYATMKKFTKNVRFIWYLILYERCLAIHTDIANIVEKIFELSNKVKEMLQMIETAKEEMKKAAATTEK